MENMIPRGNWLDDDIFRTFVREVAPLHFGSWSLTDVERATSALGWELRDPKEVAGQVWRRFAPRKGPSAGYGTLIADASEPEQLRKLNVRVVDLPPEDLATAADLIRAAWWVMEDELGPPTLWGGDSGPWMLWRRPGTSMLVHSHDGGEVSFELLPAATDSDGAGRGYSRGRWRAAEPADLPPASPELPGTTWEQVEKRLAETLRSLGHDTPFFPGRFILHLGDARDPQRFVQCWSQDLSLVVEATGHLHRPDAADPARLARNGWEFSRSIWQRRFPDAMDDPAHAATAARMLVEELRQLGVDLADLSYDGTMSGRGRGLHLDLPDLGIPRVHHPAA
ncbi:TY-Chap domain-containing protein [Streptomyces rubiginosohelvolus]|uniref:TY-Chap domain-containing protein n=1 Tax=Streptomyces rubiginosohelvolus TaxID=67362 RepID=UPI0036563B6C